MSHSIPLRRLLGTATLLAGACGMCFWAVARAEPPESAEPAASAPEAAASQPAAERSSLDAPLFYQLLIGEIELRSGEPGTAYQVILDAAKRTHDEQLFRRAVDIALGARAGDQALAATRAWRSDQPRSADATRMQVQILSALNRTGELAEPLRALLDATPAPERPGLIAALPRFVGRNGDAKAAAQVLDDALAPYAETEGTRVPVLVTRGRAWLAAGDGERALQFARDAAAADAKAAGPVLLALELMGTKPEAEDLVKSSLARPEAELGLRLGYVRALTAAQRYPEAVDQLEAVTRNQPELAPPWLSLGALYLELKRPREGEQALQRYLALAAKAAAPDAGSDDDSSDEAPAHADDGTTQALLMLAQSAEQRHDYKAAEAWLAKIDDPKHAIDVQARRAGMLAQQGRLKEARDLIRRAPERESEDARTKLLAEAGLLRDTHHWQEAHDVLAEAVKRWPEDTELIYEQAMMAEKLDRVDDMERLLRRVIALKPDDAHAHNALGYSLADRRVRLPEARQLIQRALELAPGDPFITDSLGWVEYRMGNYDEALKLLRSAYQARPDTEIAAHLGEVLWSFGQRDEAKKVWQEAKTRDAANDVLRETLSRLKVGM